MSVVGVMLALAVAMIVVVKVLVLAVAVIKTVVGLDVLVVDVRADLVRDTLADMEIIVLPTVVFVSEFVASERYSADVLSDEVTDELVNALGDIIRSFVSDIGVEVLADVNANIFEAVMTALELAPSTPLEECKC